ncbi:MAG: histidine phosphatase family protein [Gammaproteobacteria bacterium]|nr:histidine phosphatase family protein [Gammaproteobacteria bacterium]
MRQLLLMRHGKSDWSTPGQADFERPLRPRGIRATRRIGQWLLDAGLAPSRIVASPALRAKTTAHELARTLGAGRAAVAFDARIYEASTATLLHCIAEHGAGTDRLMLIGHNPGFEDTAGYLANAPLPAGARGAVLPTAALAIIELACAWNALTARCAYTVRIVRPREL